MTDPACPSFPVPLEPGRNVVRGDGCDLDGVMVRSGDTTVTLHVGRREAVSTDLGSLTVVSVSPAEAVVDVVVEGSTIVPPNDHTIVLTAPRVPGSGGELPSFGWALAAMVVLAVLWSVLRLVARKP